MSLIKKIRDEEREDLLARIDADTAAEPCGCPACDGGVQSGHFACSQPSEAMLKAEAAGLVSRHYEDGAWRWFTA